MVLRKDSIRARAKQILRVEDDQGPNVRRNFLTRIKEYHPDRKGSTYMDQAKALIEAYKVLSGRIKPLNCKLLEDDDLVASLLPKGVKPVKLGMRYEDWMKDRFYGFVKPHETTDPENRRKERIRKGL